MFCSRNKRCIPSRCGSKRELPSRAHDPRAIASYCWCCCCSCVFIDNALACLPSTALPASQHVHQAIIGSGAVLTARRLAGLDNTGKQQPFLFALQDFFDLNIADKTRNQVCKDLAALAATTGAPQDGVEDLLSLPAGDNINPGSKISQVRPCISCGALPVARRMRSCIAASISPESNHGDGAACHHTGTSNSSACGQLWAWFIVSNLATSTAGAQV